jgi:hypothetical protein
VRPQWRWWLVAGSVALIAAATLLPFGATPAEQLPPRWCLACGGLWAADAVSNVLLFLPLGLSLGAVGLGAPLAIALGALLSVAVELSQSVSIPPGRSPALADIVTNTAGTAVGLLLLTHGASLRRATTSRAAALAAGWWVAAVAALLGTAAAEQRGAAAPVGNVARSKFDYSPGYGWYGGTPLRAELSAAGGGPWAIEHHGTGPIVAQAGGPSNAWQVKVITAGRDSATYRRALLYLHTTRDSVAELVVAQHDHIAELLIRRRAWDWGLAFPSLSLPGAFGEAGHHDTLTLDASALRDRLTLGVERRGSWHEVTLPLSPALGWAMLQTLVGVGHPLAGAVALLWLATLFLPVAWWAARSGKPLVAAVSGVATAAALLGVSPLLGVAPIGARDMGFALTAWGLGLLAGRRAIGRHPAAPPG